jgi:hypothetical protein
MPPVNIQATHYRYCNTPMLALRIDNWAPLIQPKLNLVAVFLVTYTILKHFYDLFYGIKNPYSKVRRKYLLPQKKDPFRSPFQRWIDFWYLCFEPYQSSVFTSSHYCSTWTTLTYLGHIPPLLSDSETNSLGINRWIVQPNHSPSFHRWLLLWMHEQILFIKNRLLFYWLSGCVAILRFDNCVT